ncbi:MAG TPA: carboxypeptidase regulatory-like domain-containing protein [Gemmatimonadaceae bacterium]|nr:carboxypeptidase regulatory-like domain-containing protein [Gemmatimonadaceae bacterium]
MHSPRPRIVALAMALATISAAGIAQKPAVLFGVVTNLNGVRIGGVEMTLVNASGGSALSAPALHVVTNDSGEFIFDSPPTGKLRMTARRIGFKPQEKGFKLDVGASRQEDFELEGIAELLDSIHVTGVLGTGRMAEFWNRRAGGLGAFITRADIERRKPYRPSDLLRTVSGVRVTGDNALDRPVIQMGRTSVQPSTRGGAAQLGGRCVVNYYVDGSWVSPGTFHIDDISPSSIEAMEVYRGPAEIPPRFRQRETACGLIVIWTREPPPKEKPDLESPWE